MKSHQRKYYGSLFVIIVNALNNCDRSSAFTIPLRRYTHSIINRLRDMFLIVATAMLLTNYENKDLVGMAVIPL
ncbi:hypothetical protein HZC31_01215 [Candidatus Woesearchaeota archaeon]|nr:hypothetical protein [Candidatus Woesearchaeota archaeon]